jgi:hypothetical protein
MVFKNGTTLGMEVNGRINYFNLDHPLIQQDVTNQVTIKRVLVRGNSQSMQVMKQQINK